MNYLKKWWNNCKSQALAKQIQYIREDFKIKENKGILYLTYNDIAFCKMDADATAKDISYMLNNARDVAQEYRSL